MAYNLILNEVAAATDRIIGAFAQLWGDFGLFRRDF